MHLHPCRWSWNRPFCCRRAQNACGVPSGQGKPGRAMASHHRVPGCRGKLPGWLPLLLLAPSPRPQLLPCLRGARLLSHPTLLHSPLLIPPLPGTPGVTGIESQNHRTVGVGRDLCGSPSPTLPLKQGHLQQAVEDPGQTCRGCSPSWVSDPRPAPTHPPGTTAA